MRLLLILAVITSTIQANIIHVPAEITTIQQAIDEAVNLDTIQLAQGTYMEQIDLSGKNITICSNYYQTNDIMDIMLTILSASTGTVLKAIDGENAYINGLTIDAGMEQIGARTSHCQLQFKDMIFRNSGTGIRMDTSSVIQVDQCQFIDNGTGIIAPYNWGASVLEINNCYFENASAEYDLDIEGHVVVSVDSSQFYQSAINMAVQDDGLFTISHSTISHSARQGLSLRGFTTAVLVDVIFSDITLGSYFGGAPVYMYGIDVGADFHNVVFTNNGVETSSVIYMQPHAPGTAQYYEVNLDHCTFYGNTGVCLIVGSLHTQLFIDHCTVVDNQISSNLLHSVWGEDSDFIVQNSIFWNNGSNWIDPGSATLDLDYCIVDGGKRNVENGFNWGDHNLDVEPLFVNQPDGDYALQYCSPAVNAGDPSWSHDQDGSVTDMGANTYDPNTGDICVSADFEVSEFYGTAPFTVGLTDLSVVENGMAESYEWTIFSDTDTISFSGLSPTFTIDDPGLSYSADLTVNVGQISHRKELRNIVFTLGDTIHVDQAHSGSTGAGTVQEPFLTIGEAIAAAVDHDIILVYEGIYAEPVNFNGKNLFLASEYWLDGDQSHIANTIIQGNDNRATVNIRSHENKTAHLIGFSLIDGGMESLGGIYNSGGLSIVNRSGLTASNLIIRDNDSWISSGIQVEEHSDLTASHIEVFDNHTYSTNGNSVNRFVHSRVDLSYLSLNNCLTYTNTGSGMISISASKVKIDHLSLRANNSLEALVKCGGGSNVQLSNSILWDSSVSNPIKVTNSGNNLNRIKVENVMRSEDHDLLLSSGDNLVEVLNDHTDDPMYCNSASGVLTIQEESPCAGLANDGSALGAFTPGCLPVTLLDIPQTVFDEDEIQRIHISFLEPYLVDWDTPIELMSWNFSGAQHTYVILVDDTLQIHPEPDWTGQDTINISVTDGYSESTGDWVITLSNVSDPPDDFDLLWPPNDTLFDSGADTSITFTWENTSDADGDTLEYTLHLSSDGVDLGQFVTMENWVTVNVSDFPRNQPVDWLVVASDGENTTSSEAWVINIDWVVALSNALILPEDFILKQNYPNPFNPVTTIEYGLPFVSDVQLQILDIRGRVVNNWIMENHNPGWFSLQWSGRDLAGKQLGSGVYFAVLQSNAGNRIIRMTYLR